jgi:hypothetical protein
LPEETGLGERQPLIMKGIKAGVVPDERRDSTTVTDAQVSEATQVVELGLPIMCVKPFSRLRHPVASLMGTPVSHTRSLVLCTSSDGWDASKRSVQQVTTRCRPSFRT